MGTFGFIDTSYDDQLSTCSDAVQPLLNQITNSSSELSFDFHMLSRQQLSSATQQQDSSENNNKVLWKKYL